jgi:ubiquinone biosynthesis protein
MFGKRLKHAHRYQEIISAFLRNGFGYLVKELGLTEMMSIPRKMAGIPKETAHRTTGERLRKFLEELGPTFIKLGQIASTRRDLIPEHMIIELAKLQDNVPPCSYDQIRKIIENELGGKLETIFAEFDEVPLATASIGQVHQAKLHTNETVAVKIQRPNIRPNVETDLEILHDLVKLMEVKLGWARKYRLGEILSEFAKSLRNELDYYIEGNNCEKFAKQFSNKKDVVIPKIFWDYSTKTVLTMEYIQGIKVNDLKAIDQHGYHSKIIAERLTNAMLHQILIEGTFHGDPHPGNVLILPGEKIGFIDFGNVGRLGSDLKNQFATLVISLKSGSTDGVIRAISQMGIIPGDADMSKLRNQIEQLKEKYYDQPISQISFGEAVIDLQSVAFTHQIQIPADLTILGKTLLTVEGIISELDPDFSMMKAAEPFGEQLLKERYNPKKIAENTWSHIVEYAELLTDLPRKLRGAATVIQKGKLRIEISVPELQQLLVKMDKISNRLSFAIVLLAFSIIMVGLIVGASISGQTTLIWRVPAVEIGFTIAIFMLLWLLFAIFKSGRF